MNPTSRPKSAKSAKSAPTYPKRVAVARGGMVSTAHWEASEVGARTLAAGGNAIDAAIAAACALGVCEPAASGLGGQTTMLIHLAEQRKTLALDGSSRAPHRTPPAELPKSERLRGHRATTVPSTPAMFGYAVETYGNLDFSQVIEGAIDLAERGYAITELQHRLAVREKKHLAAGTAARFFLRNGEPRPVGAKFRQPILGKTLRRMADVGWRDFYQGEIAQAIAEDMERHGGLIQLDDLAQIPMPIERRPVSGRFAGLRVFTYPPPGAGRTLLEILNVLEQFPPKRRNPDTPDGAALLAEVIRRANLDRRDRPFDPNFYPQVDDTRMVSEDYARLVAKQVRVRLRRRGETTHLSVMDGAGNAVALTQSIERVYGSFAASPKLGFLYNNYMSAFELEDITHPYYLRPNAVPWASVAPTIVMRGRKTYLALGSPGSERIASSIAQVLLRLENQLLPEAIAAPRLHCNLTGEVTLEASRMRDDIGRRLVQLGFSVREVEPFSFYLGCVQAVQRDGDDIIGVADLRRDGAAIGYHP